VNDADLRRLVGHPLADADGKVIGQVEVVFSDDETGQPAWMGVLTGMLRHRHVLVPVAGAQGGDPSVRVPWKRARLKQAPTYDRSDRIGALGLGEYRLAISQTKASEARAYYGLGDAGGPGPV
jgi:hypothetical protein